MNLSRIKKYFHSGWVITQLDEITIKAVLPDEYEITFYKKFFGFEAWTNHPDLVEDLQEEHGGYIMQSGTRWGWGKKF